ncbi:heat shock transcription factor, Y-linked-like [Grus americana]|uniref:heat shock transcription factor, Y-linked-like n=1 Tax=Grus americana TaxID=9117 RepID=UPI0024080792|nr:heat shock transcription factor, Y-linked-like [Grus americana]
MELSSSETSCDSVLANGVESSALTSLCPPCDKIAASDAAFGPPTEEGSLQSSTKQPGSKREHLKSSEEGCSKGHASICLSFLKKLWDVVDNDLFESIWWGDNGKSIVIHEELFEEEVLARKGRLKIFESESMRSFTHELHLHGFTRKLWDFPKSGSRKDLLAEERLREFHFYYNPHFRRHFPYQLMKYKQSFGLKNQVPARFARDMALYACLQKRKADAELAWEDSSEEKSGPFPAGPRQKRRTFAPRKTAHVKAAARVRRTSTSARTAPQTNSGPAAAVDREKLHPLPPSLLPQHSSPGPAGAQGAASAAAAPGPAVPSSPFLPGLAAAAAVSVLRPPQGPSPPYQQRPTCTGPEGDRAGNGLGPQPGAC